MAVAHLSTGATSESEPGAEDECPVQYADKSSVIAVEGVLNRVMLLTRLSRLSVSRVLSRRADDRLADGLEEPANRALRKPDLDNGRGALLCLRIRALLDAQQRCERCDFHGGLAVRSSVLNATPALVRRLILSAAACGGSF
jgi:hypothetical protein